MVRRLISHDADVNQRTRLSPPLFYAIWQGHKGIVKALIEAGANVNKQDDQGWTPLRHALDQTDVNVVKQFVGAGVKIPDFHNAALEGDISKVRQFVESGMDVDTRDKLGWTPTYWAVSTGHDEVFKYLLSQGANVNVIGRGGTELHWAAYARQSVDEKRYAEVVKKLLAVGADVHAKDPQRGRTPLHMAAKRGRYKVAELLIAAGAEVNAKDKEGHTPLWYSKDKYTIREDDTRTVEILRKHGAKE